jgi:DNA (cytosine-5)-methyltransferase 1
MRYISLFSGIEAASVAWGPLGFEPVAFSEIDQFPKAVLARHYPDVPDLGDITKIDWSGYVGSADVVVGGSPCQSFSIAGTRAGLDGASGLMWEYVRAVRELRPEWFVWENVPGALSSSNGEDFRCLLESMDELGYGLAWRVLDAQFFGVAQRRRRVFVVGHLGDRRAAEVLFEREGMSWDIASSRAKRQALTQGTQNSARTAGFYFNQGAKARSLAISDELSPTLKTDHNPAVYQIAGNIIGRDDMNGGHQLGVVDPDEDGAFTLTATDRHAVYCASDSGSNSSMCEDVAPTLTAHDAKSASYVSVPSTLQIRSGKAGGGKGALVQDDMSATLTCGLQQTLFPGDGSVRRLTPLEFERLQGFPDGWTDIPYRGKPHASDSARYKALGNSMAVPVMRWLGRRIKEVAS